MTQTATTTARYEIVYSEPAGELLVDNERGLVWQLSDYFIPTAAWITSLTVGDRAPNAFGNLAEVTEIIAQRNNFDGVPFVCVELRQGEYSTITNSFTAKRLNRSVNITGRHTSVELDAIERLMVARAN